MNTLRGAYILGLFMLLATGFAGCAKSCKNDDAPAQSSQSGSAENPAPQTTPANTETPTPAASTADLTTDDKGLSKATIVMRTSKGTLKFKLYAKDAPNTAKTFADLVQSKFYNGQSFHRIIPGFIIQTGDPRSKNKNDSEIGHVNPNLPKLKAEFNGRRHIRGTVAMARVTSDPDSADTQFYITLNAFSHLDEKYTVFGQVVDFGEKVGDKDVLDRITLWDDLIEMRIE